MRVEKRLSTEQQIERAQTRRRDTDTTHLEEEGIEEGLRDTDTAQLERERERDHRERVSSRRRVDSREGEEGKRPEGESVEAGNEKI